MTLEEKQLLLQDLCQRLPYNILCTDLRHGDSAVASIDLEDGLVYCSDFDEWVEIEQCKPYLRQMSSMTEEEFVYFMDIRGMNLRSYEIQEMMSEYFSHPNKIAIVNTLGKYSHKIDWLNKKMFDYRGLIEMGLALESKEGMYSN